ncbi:DNA repair and recombination protein RadA [Methanonatronarchaeum sp. AMET-Sl]|uniref:DNA repair and recombination protein RadA n=1 Tax=Methanonatronarchaeum sp. AMET-Sl TaxID=3037654 RepID=UPI00244E3C1B|nr:DNA repair and recombination protein RadA [Methanonatronarchaeum sp. AMET-Sl]WGI17579.1 DNA repair and recombination protein RadA [Methanonatronarchaeum sp. AMET-Sl]
MSELSQQEKLEELPGVGPATADKLIENEFDSLEAIAVSSPSELSAKVDIGEKTAINIIDAARKEADIGGFETGNKLMEKRANIGKITTMADDFDRLLGGGIETQTITEMYGEYGSGKTQIAHQLAVAVQLPEEEGGLNSNAIYIDTENSFRPERIKQMARELELDEEEVLDKIYVARAYNSNHQMLLSEKARELAKEIKENDGDVRLLIIDSLTSHFRAEYVGRGSLAERQQKLNKHLHEVIKFTDLFNAAALVTNQVQSNPDAFFGDPTRPIGGNILGHMATYRLYLRKSKGDKRIARLVDSPCMPEGESVFTIGEEGIRDA